jgi:hypothetical protein
MIFVGWLILSIGFLVGLITLFTSGNFLIGLALVVFGGVISLVGNVEKIREELISYFAKQELHNKIIEELLTKNIIDDINQDEEIDEEDTEEIVEISEKERKKREMKMYKALNRK